MRSHEPDDLPTSAAATVAAPDAFVAPHPGSTKMPQWGSADLIDAPHFTWRNWFAMIGPGLVAGGSAIGGGEWLMGPVAAYNLVVLLSFATSGLTVYLLVGEIGASRLSRFCAGFLFTFSTYHFARAAGHLGLLTIQFLPFFAWRLLVFFRSPSWRSSILAGVALALVPLSDIYYAPYFALPFGIMALLRQVWLAPSWLASRRNLILVTAVAAVGLGLAVPPLHGFLHIDPGIQQAIEQQRGSTEDLSTDLAALFVPAAANPFLGALVAPVYARMATPFKVETYVFLGHGAILRDRGMHSGTKTRWARATPWRVMLVVPCCDHGTAAAPRRHDAPRSGAPPASVRGTVRRSAFETVMLDILIRISGPRSARGRSFADRRRAGTGCGSRARRADRRPCRPARR